MSGKMTWTESTIGYKKGYDYELWKDEGNTSMDLLENGTFRCQWDNINNALFRAGKKYYFIEKPVADKEDIVVNYGVDYRPQGNSYLCVYGWLKNPLVEYYIVDSWGTWRPPGAEPKGQICVDGGTYDVYVTIRENQPSIEGDTTFTQYWSVRTEKKTEGTISVYKHFEEWTKFGLELGNLYEVALTVEGYQSKGYAEVYKNELIVTKKIPEKKYVAMTFDDGPNTVTTQQMLDVLEEFGVPGTFFLIGQYINDDTREVMKRQLKLGCELENHSFTHTAFTELTVEQMQEQVAKTNELIREVTGRTPMFFRPPFISVNDQVFESVDMPFIMGHMCTDWDENNRPFDRAGLILKQVKDGSIILLHDTYGNSLSVRALQLVLEALKEEGYEFVTLSELFRIKGIDPRSKGNHCWNIVE